MSAYSAKGKGWRYDFTHKGIRHTAAWFKTKKEARQAEAEKRKELENPTPVQVGIGSPQESNPNQTTQTDMDFLALVNKRLDHIKAYNSERYYTDHLYMARRWFGYWRDKTCNEIDAESIRQYLLQRFNDVSAFTANKELRCLKATFNFAMHPTRKWLDRNPALGIEFFPLEKRIKYVPSREDLLKVILAAEPETQDYLWTITLTLARMSEINKLTWQDVDFQGRSVILYTRKKRGGHLTPRRIPMIDKLYDLLWRRYQKRDKTIPWVFWHRYWSRKANEWVVGHFIDRKLLMRSLCNKVGVKYFRFHALRHFGASMLAQANVPIGTIQRFLGHELQSTTEIYLHAIGEPERDAMVFLWKIFDEISHTESHTKKTGSQR